MSASIAKKCFEENIRLFSNPNSQPEKYNMYNGLANLARAVGDLEDKVRSLEKEVRKLS